jgi:endonuclease YncB( thermonuclease family)
VGRGKKSMSGWRKAANAAGIVFLGVALAGCGDAPPSDYDFTGDVTKIVDGDTFYMTSQEVRVRI